MFIGRRQKNRRFRLLWALNVGLFVVFGLFFAFSSLQPAEAVLYQPLSNQRPKDFAVVRKDGVWHAYAIWCDVALGCDALRRGLMHLTSTDLKNWTEVGFVLAPDGGSDFDDYDIWAPSIVERDGTYYMYYTGVYKNGSNTWVQKIGLATSTDLNTWTKYSTTPVVDCSTFTWGVYYDTANSSDGAACRDANVTWDQNEHQWVMTLSTRTTLSAPANLMTIAIATSEDLVTWREYGRIPTTDDYTSESSHRIEHNGTNYIAFTDNCSPQPCVKYVSSTSLYSGYGSQAGFPTIENNAYASEYFADHGREYFARIDGTTNQKLDFDELAWTGSPVTIQEVSYGSIGDDVWTDSDADGVHDGSEAGVNGVTLRLYLDDGDALYDPTTDDLYSTTTSGDDPNTLGTQTGYYRFTDVVPGSYWVIVDSTNLTTGGALAGQVSTTASTATFVTVTNNQAVTTVDHGYTSGLTDFDFSSASPYTLSGATVSSGRVTPTPTTAWWDKNFQYRKQITVTAGTEALTTSHTLDLAQDLGALITAGKIQSDYDDVRLVFWNGSAFVPVEIDIVSATVQRFKVQSSISTSASDTNYYLYYGNPDATMRPTRLANVYPYYTSFNSKDQSTYGSWTESTSSWDIVSNRWKFTGSQVAGDRFSRDTATTINLSDDWQLEVTANINAGGSIASPTFHSTQAFGNEEYHTNFDATNDRIQFYHWAFGQLGSNVPYTINTAQDYRLGFSYNYVSSTNHTTTAYVNGATAASVDEVIVGYDIWYEGTCPCTTKNAYLALGTFNSQTSYNDLKAWQAADGSAVTAGTEAPQYVAATATVTPTTSITFGRLQNFYADVGDQNGSVKFVLSNDDGASWLWWNGSAWATSNQTSSEANTPDEVAAQAGSFPSGGLSLRWRALLVATANTQPTLFGVSLSSNQAPTTPIIATPSDRASVTPTPSIIMMATDAGESDSLAYEIQLDTDPGFTSGALRTIRQTDSQFGWTSQNRLGNTRYASGATATYTVTNALSAGTWYWRSRTIDPEGSNVYSPYSATRVIAVQTDLVMSSITVTNTSTTTATIEWGTSELASAILEYGPTIAYGLSSTVAAATTQSIILTDLTRATLYHYRIRATNSSGDIVRSGDRTFITNGTTINGLTVTSLTPRSVVVTWTTTEPVRARLRLTSASETSAYVGRPYATTHRVVMKKLNPLTRYTAVVTAAGSHTVAASKKFTTLAAGISAPKVLSAVARGSEITVVAKFTKPATVEISLDGKRASQYALNATNGLATLRVTRQSRAARTLRIRYTDSYGRLSPWSSAFTIK